MIASLNVVTFCCERDQEHSNCMHIRFKDASVAYNHPRRGHFRNSNDTYSHKTHRCIRYWSTVVVPMLSVSNGTILYAIYMYWSTPVGVLYWSTRCTIVLRTRHFLYIYTIARYSEYCRLALGRYLSVSTTSSNEHTLSLRVKRLPSFVVPDSLAVH